ncbi:hypothetical protein Tco_0217733 [Tanacetum coccineum]
MCLVRGMSGTGLHEMAMAAFESQYIVNDILQSGLSRIPILSNRSTDDVLPALIQSMQKSAWLFDVLRLGSTHGECELHISHLFLAEVLVLTVFQTDFNDCAMDVFCPTLRGWMVTVVLELELVLNECLMEVDLQHRLLLKCEIVLCC